MARRRKKIGIGEALVIMSALAEVGVSSAKNSATDQIRNQFFDRLVPGQHGMVQAAAGVVAYEFLRKEANKAGVNPAVGPFRML